MESAIRAGRDIAQAILTERTVLANSFHLPLSLSLSLSPLETVGWSALCARGSKCLRETGRGTIRRQIDYFVRISAARISAGRYLPVAAATLNGAGGTLERPARGRAAALAFICPIW